MNTETKKTIKKLILTGIVLALLIGIGYLIMRHFGLTNITQEQLQEIIGSKGATAPLIFILVSFLQVTLIPVPGSVTILAGNYLFGPLESFIYSYVGMLAGAMVAFSLGKIIGRPFVNWLAGGKQKVDEWLVKIRGQEGVLLFFMFLFPLFPDDVLCAVAGLLPFTWGGFFAMQCVTRATSVFGTLLFMSGEIIPLKGWGLVVLAFVAVAFVVAFILCFKNAERLDNWFSGLFRRVYYGEEYFHKFIAGKKHGKRINTSGTFITRNSAWRVAGVYLCDEGLVVDIYSVSNKRHHIPDKDFTCAIAIEKEVYESEKEIKHVYLAKGRKNRTKNKKIKEFITHYKKEKYFSRVFVRCLFPCENIKEKNLNALYLKAKCKVGAEKQIEEQLVRIAPKHKKLRRTLKELFAKK